MDSQSKNKKCFIIRKTVSQISTSQGDIYGNVIFSKKENAIKFIKVEIAKLKELFRNAKIVEDFNNDMFNVEINGYQYVYEIKEYTLV